MLLPFLILTPALLHIFLFPGLVWLLSMIFYSNTFRYNQTLNFELSEHLYILVLLYTAPISFYYFKKENGSSKDSAFKDTPENLFIPTVHDILTIQEVSAGPSVPANQTDSASREIPTLREIIVTEGRKTFIVNLSEVYFFSANPPYINIHLAKKKLLHNETLKSLSVKLNDKQFVRIHKSTIVNLNQVQIYQSRLNGDYDLLLKDGTKLRISRNYASDFKEKFRQ